MEVDVKNVGSAKKKGGSKWSSPLRALKRPWFLIIAGGVLLVSAALAAGGWFFFLRQEDPAVSPPPALAQAEGAGETAENQEPAFEDIVEMEPFDNVKLGKSGRLNAVAMQISLELVDPGMRKALEADRLKIREIVEQETGKQTWLVLRSPQGKLEFKYTLIERINSVLPRAEIKNLYFTQLIMK